jgi:hypothetical protein
MKTYVVVSGQLHAPVALPLKETALDLDAVEEEIHVLFPEGNLNPDSSV